MDKPKINKSTKYLDQEKIFLEEFKKLLNSGIIVRKKNKLIGYTFYHIKIGKTNRELIITNTSNDKSKTLDICEINSIEIFDTTKIRIIEKESTEFEVQNDTIANIFKDGILLLKKERLALKSVLMKLVEDFTDESESERESISSVKSFSSQIVEFSN